MLGMVSSPGVLFSAQWEEAELRVAAEALLAGQGLRAVRGAGLSWCEVLATPQRGDGGWLEDTAMDTAGHCCGHGRTLL